MKKQTMSLAIALAALISFSSCCKKDNTNENSTAKSTGNTANSSKSLYRTGDKITFDPRVDDCVEGPNKTCLDPVVIKPKKMTGLDDAILKGGLGLQELFSDEVTALSLIPEFNSPDFAAARQLILAGNATFIREDKADHILYLIKSNDDLQGLPVMVINYIEEQQ